MSAVSRYPVISNFVLNTSPLHALKILAASVAVTKVASAVDFKPKTSYVATFWMGIIACLSIEAIVKFSAPGLKREDGLRVGQTVFSAINRLELLVAAFFAASLANVDLKSASPKEQIAFGGPLTILGWQTFWGMPALVRRASDIFNGVAVDDHGLNHRLYVVAELAKVALLGFAMKLGE